MRSYVRRIPSAIAAFPDMSDAFYTLVRSMGLPVFALSSRASVLHSERLKAKGPLIIAPNHLSPYDIPCLMASTSRVLDFVAMKELFRHPCGTRFFGRMNAIPLDRGRADPMATRTILERLARGRVVVIFPEGGIRTPRTSMLAGGPFDASVLRLARLAGVPVMGCVILGTGSYARASAWLPLRRTRYAVGFAPPVWVMREGDEEAACADAVARLRAGYQTLCAELCAASGLSLGPDLPAP
jgi:1-acyl-sn-glycerol-3-phosphate acyltransferase